MARCCEHGCGLTGAVNGELFLNLLSGCWLFKKNFTPRNWIRELTWRGDVVLSDFTQTLCSGGWRPACFSNRPALQLAVQVLIHGISGFSCQAFRTVSPATSIKCVNHFWGLKRDGELELNGLMIAFVEYVQFLCTYYGHQKLTLIVVHEICTYRFSIFEGNNVLGSSHLVVPPSVTGSGSKSEDDTANSLK